VSGYGYMIFSPHERRRIQRERDASDVVAKASAPTLTCRVCGKKLAADERKQGLCMRCEERVEEASHGLA